MRPLLLLALLGTVCCAATPAIAQETTTVAAQLLELSWRYEALGSAERGPARLILFGPDSWRLEIGRTDRDDPGSRQGEGWTLSAPGDSCLYLQPWHGALETLAAGESVRLRALVRLTAGEDPASLVDLPGLSVTTGGAAHQGSRRWPWTAAAVAPPDPTMRRLRWQEAAGVTLLERGETRGLGRGAATETWSWRGSPDGLRFASNRRPGHLVVRTVERRTVSADPFEATLPVWSLDELALEPVPE